MIGNDVTVTVVAVNGTQVRIGVDAPKDVAVHREEIYGRVQREKADELEQRCLRQEVATDASAEGESGPRA